MILAAQDQTLRRKFHLSLLKTDHCWDCTDKLPGETPCLIYNIPVAKKWWEHKVEKVVAEGDMKILWDFKTQTDRDVESNESDIKFMIKKKQVWCEIKGLRKRKYSSEDNH